MRPITVLIPVYNSAPFIQDTINSVLSQTFPDFELLAMDDGSTDQGPEIIRSYMDSRTRYIPCKHNFIATINKGLQLSNGKYIALIDHDDIMMPYRLRTQYEFMEANPDVSACGGYMHTFGNYSIIEKNPLDHASIILMMLHQSPIHNPTGFIRNDVLKEHQIHYKNGYSFSADYKLWSDIAKVGKLANIPKILTLYRRHDHQTSVKHLEKCLTGGRRVKKEILQYLISKIKKENQLTRQIAEEFFPAVENLKKQFYFSENIYYAFVYELISGLRKNNLIDY